MILNGSCPNNLGRALRAMALCAVLLQTACKSMPPVSAHDVEKPTERLVAVSIVASGDLNPDADDRPSPLALNLYVLSAPAKFEGASMDALLTEDSALADQLIGHQRMMIRPGERTTETVRAPVNAVFIAAAAEYRDVLGSVWKAVVALPQAEQGQVSSSQMTVELMRGTVKLRTGQ